MEKITLDVEVNSFKAESQLKSFTAAIAEISESLNNIKINRNLTAQINAITKNYNALAKAADKVTKIHIRNRIEEQKLVAATNKATAADLRRQIAEEQQKKAKEANIEASKEQIEAEKELSEAHKKSEDVTRNEQSATEKLTEAIQEIIKASKEQKKDSEENKQNMGSLLTQLPKWLTALIKAIKPLDLLKKALGSVNKTLVETENRVSGLKRALGQSIGNQEISDGLYDIAKRYGQTFESVSDMALSFARTGMSWADSIKATEAAVLALNITDLDAAEASNGMIAILQQFGLEASDLIDVVDKLNITADNGAVTANALLSALQRTGSSAANANLTLEQTVGIVNALSEATGQSGENLGVAVNSLIQLSTKAASLDAFARINDDLAVTVDGYRHGTNTVLDIWHELSEVVKPGNLENESILSGMLEGEDWQSLNQELEDTLGKNFATVNEIYDTASTYRNNYFIALLNNMDQVEESIATMGGAAGYSMRENEEYLDTYTAKVNSLKAAWEELANDEQGLLAMKKSLVEAATTVLKLVDAAGGLRTVFIAAGTTLSIIFAPKMVQGSISMVKGFKNLGSAIKAATTASYGLNVALGALGAIATVLSIIAGINEQNRAKEREANLAAIEAAENNREKAQSLQKLYSQYKQLQGVTNRTEEENNTYYRVESQIVELLGDKAAILKTLNKESDDYTKAINNMTEAELKNYRMQLRLAAEAAKDELLETNTHGATLWRQDSSEILGKDERSNTELRDALLKILDDEGIEVSKGLWNQIDIRGFSDRKTIADKLENYKLRRIIVEAINSKIEKDLEANDNEYTDYSRMLQSSHLYNFSGSVVNHDKEVVDKYFSTQAEMYLRNYNKDYGEVTTQEQLNNATNFILERMNKDGIDSYFNEDIKTIITSLVLLGKEQEDENDAINEWANSLEAVSKHYSEIVDSLDAILDKEKKAIDLERQKKALEDAKNQRNVRVFNARTGQWEWQANAKEVAEAEDALKQTTADLIKEQLESGNTTNEQMLTILEDIDEYIPDFVETVKGVIKDKTGVDLDKPLLPEKTADTPEAAEAAAMLQKLASSPLSNRSTEDILRASYTSPTNPFSPVLKHPEMVPQWMIDKTTNNTTNYTLNGIPLNAEDVWDKRFGDLIMELNLLAHGNES